MCNVSLHRSLLSGFISHQAVARTAGNVLIRLADSLVLPLNCSDYAEILEAYLSVALSQYEQQLHARNISMGKHRTMRHVSVMQGNIWAHRDSNGCFMALTSWNNPLIYYITSTNTLYSSRSVKVKSSPPERHFYQLFHSRVSLYHLVLSLKSSSSCVCLCRCIFYVFFVVTWFCLLPLFQRYVFCHIFYIFLFSFCHLVTVGPKIGLSLTGTCMN